MGRAYFVVGPEGSGNRYMVRLLVGLGCAGRGDIEQPFDGPGYAVAVPAGAAGPVALFRSFPHGHAWPDLAADASALRDAGLEPTVLVMARDQRVVPLSQVRAGQAADVAQGQERCRRAYLAIFAGLLALEAAGRPVDFTLIHYNRLAEAAYRAWLPGRLGLPPAAALEAYLDGDAKYGAGAG